MLWCNAQAWLSLADGLLAFLPPFLLLPQYITPFPVETQTTPQVQNTNVDLLFNFFTFSYQFLESPIPCRAVFVPSCAVFFTCQLPRKNITSLQALWPTSGAQESTVAGECFAPAPPVCLWKREAFETELEQKNCCLHMRKKNLLHSYNSDTSKQLEVSLDKGKGEEKGMVEKRGIQIFFVCL